MDESLIESAYYASGINNFATHFHKCHEVIFVKKGSLRIDCAGREYTVPENTLFFISNLEHHSITVLSREYCRYCLQISPASARCAVKSNTLCSIFSNRPEGFSHLVDVSAVKDEIEYIFSGIVNEVQNPRFFGFEAQKALLRLLLICVYRNRPECFPLKMTVKNDIVNEIQKDFEHDYSCEYSLDMLAKRHHISKSYLSHLFKEITGYGVMEYLAEHRLSIAKDLLCTTDKSAARVAEETGFSTGGNFARYLKCDTGMTPREYRNAHKKESLHTDDGV